MMAHFGSLIGSRHFFNLVSDNHRSPISDSWLYLCTATSSEWWNVGDGKLLKSAKGMAICLLGSSTHMYLRKEDLACCRAVPQLTQVHGISHVLGLPSLSASFANFFFPKPAKSSFDQKGFVFQHRVCFFNSLHCHADHQPTTSRLPADYQPTTSHLPTTDICLRWSPHNYQVFFHCVSSVMSLRSVNRQDGGRWIGSNSEALVWWGGWQIRERRRLLMRPTEEHDTVKTSLAGFNPFSRVMSNASIPLWIPIKSSCWVHINGWICASRESEQVECCFC